MTAPVNPYRGLPSTSFWSSGVAQAGPGGLDPVAHAKFTIGPDDRVATMGSCFAQHISRFLVRSGMPYFVAEPAPEGMSAEEAERRNYGVFSARFGNVYTVKQARQLLRRAFGSFAPDEDVWEWNDRVVDALRPQIEPEGFASRDDLAASREVHFEAVRRMFGQCDVLVFTLGLTESWESLLDATVYPVAPGVHGGSFDPDRHRFTNASVVEVIDDLDGFVREVRAVNAGVRVMLTVSPVPLIATYEDRHVLVSTVASKAILRAAADAVSSRFDWVDYFPSYEIIAGSAAGAGYFEPDLRQVSARGVSHVMRVFGQHYLSEGAAPAPTSGIHEASPPRTPSGAHVVCDEELIEAALGAVGMVGREPGGAGAR